MLDKIRLPAMGKLPAEYQTNIGDTQPEKVKRGQPLTYDFRVITEKSITTSSD